jgi:hypothetical protein
MAAEAKIKTYVVEIRPLKMIKKTTDLSVFAGKGPYLFELYFYRYADIFM